MVDGGPEPGRPQDDVGVHVTPVVPRDTVRCDPVEHRLPVEDAVVQGLPDRVVQRQSGHRDDTLRWQSLANPFLHERDGRPAELLVEGPLTENGRPTCHPGGRSGVRGDLHQMLGAGGAAAHHDHPQTGEPFGARVLRRVQLPPAEGLLPSIARPEGPVPCPGGIDQRTRRPGPGRGLHKQPARGALAHRTHVDRSAHPQLEGALIGVEVLRDDLGGRARRVRVRQFHAGQRVHPVHLAVRQ